MSCRLHTVCLHVFMVAEICCARHLTPAFALSADRIAHVQAPPIAILS